MHVPEVVHMAGMGLLVSTVAPLVLLATRHRFGWRWLSWPAPVALPAFVLAHTVIMLQMAPHDPPIAAHVLLDTLLVVGALVFWLPVLGTRRRLDALGRAVYLFLGAPALDLAGVIIVARGQSTGGLAMIVGMLPIGLTAVLLTWRWLCAEEAEARRLDELDAAQRRWSHAQP